MCPACPVGYRSTCCKVGGELKRGSRLWQRLMFAWRLCAWPRVRDTPKQQAALGAEAKSPACGPGLSWPVFFFILHPYPTPPLFAEMGREASAAAAGRVWCSPQQRREDDAHAAAGGPCGAFALWPLLRLTVH